MVTEIGGDAASLPAAGGKAAAAARGTTVRGATAARDALATLSQPHRKTEAELKLDEILRDLKSSKSKAAQDAARQKLQRIKAKLDALKLAAGSAAATGDAKLARKVAKEISDAARDLSRALAEAGGAGGGAGAVIAAAGNAASQVEQAAGGGEATRSQPASAQPAGLQPTSAQPAAPGDDLAGLKADAQAVLKELKKIMRKLRETGLHPGIAAQDRAEMEKMFAAADRELAGLAAVAAPSPGGAVNLIA